MMADAVVETKRWGDSLAVIIPAEVVRQRRMKPGEKYAVNFIRVGDLSKHFGSMKGTFPDVQKAKDEARRGWR
ncbi:MAG: AbrB/MazE/SpoVT family DNA-binding domain-containing protein [Euryarchaeota archaeon]|nr:AbrB/MazE/SpoVT family DNA-binding domain-containing protein [Euryarchaeota archaeon]